MKNTANLAVISGNWITSADEPWREESDAEDAPGPPVEARESGKGEHFSRRASIKGPKIRCSAVPVHPKAAVAGCLAMPSSAYNGTPAQPQSQAMGAARRDPRRGEIPGAQRQLRSSPAAYAWGSSVEYRQHDGFIGKPRSQVSEVAGAAPVVTICVSGSRLS